jgi:two-component system phosphate regulon response regulator PhoB
MRGIPVILLTEKSDEASVLRHLEQGADDTILRSVSPREFVARLRAIVRAKRDTADYADQIMVFERLQIHPRKHFVSIDGREVKLTATEFKILVLLASKPGWVFSREEIVSALCNGSSKSSSRSVDVIIVRLRSHLEQCSHYVESVRQVGYRFRDPENRSRKHK